jgi:hypothetical protein
MGRRTLVQFLLLLLLAGCDGIIGGRADDSNSAGPAGDTGGVQPGSAACATIGIQPGPSPIRRLTRTEYNNTVHDLLNDTTAPAMRFTQEEVGLGFTNNAEAQSVSDLLAEQYESAAIQLATTATTDLPKLLGCDPTKTSQDACVRAFLPAFGLKAYRRPLEGEEVDRLFSLYGASKGAYDFATAVRFVVAAMLQSPHFLYRVETGAPSVSRLSGFQTAARLSYLLWSTMPDGPLFAAAASGELDAPEGIAQQAKRMLKDVRANQSVATFFAQWLELDKLGKVEKDATLFPRFTPDVRNLLRKETELFITDAVLGGGNIETLLRGSYTFMNKDLASYYGVAGPEGDTFERVMLDPKRYAGLMTQAGLLASYANINQTSPVARGFFVRDRILCSPPPPPPANVNASPPTLDPSLTTRERFAAHRTSPSCAGCHTLMDPVGLGFEHFDAAGIWRDQEGGKPVDSSGELVGTKDADGPFDGVAELAAKLGASSEVRECMVRQWFRFGYGRGETELDQCTLGALDAAFEASLGDINQLLIALTQTDAFLYRTNDNGGAP